MLQHLWGLHLPQSLAAVQASSASSSSGSHQLVMEYSLSGRPTALQELTGGLWALATSMAELLLLDAMAGQTLGLLHSRVPLTLATSLCWMSAEGELAPPLLVAIFVLLVACLHLTATRAPELSAGQSGAAHLGCDRGGDSLIGFSMPGQSGAAHLGCIHGGDRWKGFSLPGQSGAAHLGCLHRDDWWRGVGQAQGQQVSPNHAGLLASVWKQSSGATYERQLCECSLRSIQLCHSVGCTAGHTIWCCSRTALQAQALAAVCTLRATL